MLYLKLWQCEIALYHIICHRDIVQFAYQLKWKSLFIRYFPSLAHRSFVMHVLDMSVTKFRNINTNEITACVQHQL